MRVEDLRQYLDEARAEIERLKAAIREAREALFNAGLDTDWSVVDDVRGALLDALSGKGKT
jgi:hypothetical protein